MSIKKLFQSTNKTRNYQADTTQKDLFKDVESARNVAAIKENQEAYVAPVDYSKPEQFARYGSAYLYYKTAVERILDYYPYDGSDAEINEFANKALGVDKYVFDNKYPRTTGYAILSADGWGTQASITDGYGLPDNLEYITFMAGPGTGSFTSGSSMKKMSPDEHNSKFQHANIYDEDIYTTEGLPSSYGSGTRESNLKSDFDRGVTIEFWAKTGSAVSLDYLGARTKNQVLVDIWNNNANTEHDYGRITIELNASASASPFLITVQSGTNSGVCGTTTSSVGQNITVDTLSSWHHYALVLQNSGSDLKTKFYLDGKLNHVSSSIGSKVGELPSKNMMGRLGALLTPPSASAASVGAGKLSGSLDEFRFWKVARSAQDIGRNWFTQVRGGVNTDISNTTLGIYYKFNEGITGTSATDSVVLDYAGRIANGVWAGYGSNSRNTGSAIVSASAASTEYADPIIYSTHPDVVSLKSSLTDTGSYHDSTNNNMFKNMVPSWVIEEHDETENNNLNYLSHIVGAYFDKMFLQITSIPKIKQTNYPSASHKPLPFAEHLPQSLGLYTPELFIDATVMEKFANRNESSLFENDLDETKNLIYINLYNNLANIYKSKGTFRAIRNVFRCFNVDEKLLRLNTYANNQTYELKNNLRQEISRKKFLNFNTASNRGAVVYQKADAGNVESLGYISGSNGAGNGYEDKYGATVEADITFPHFTTEKSNFDRRYTKVSLFGMHTVDTGSVTDTTFVSNYTTREPDLANFQVFAVKPKARSKGISFQLTSSNFPYPLPTLTSSIFFDVYDQERWNLSVRIKPSIYPLMGIVSGTVSSQGDDVQYTYDVIFRGSNTSIDSPQSSFELTGSVSRATGEYFLRSAKRAYVGAYRTNLTGALLNESDVLFSSFKYWAKYLENHDLGQHVNDFENYGISDSYRNISALDPNTDNNLDIFNLNTLALNWNFANVSSSGDAGSALSSSFYVTDISSGSALLRDNYGWLGNLAGYQHTGYGTHFTTASTAVVNRQLVNSFKFIDPEHAISSDMVRILSDDDRVYGVVETVPNYYYTLEKSMYNAISEEMLDFFAGVVDFNNTIGEPVNRYRERYKNLEKLREIFFRKVTKVSEVENFIQYYKWFDDTLSTIIGQLLPASAEFSFDVYNTIESHVLERNKYKTLYPTLEFKVPDYNAAASGYSEATWPHDQAHTPITLSPRNTKVKLDFWKKRAIRSSSEITARTDLPGDTTLADVIDSQRETIRKVAWSAPRLSQSYANSFTSDGTIYQSNEFAKSNFNKLYNISDTQRIENIKGGTNFDRSKNIHFTYDALYPAGPINLVSGSFVPLNVLVGFTEDIVKLQSVEMSDSNPTNKKIKRDIKVQHGREWEDGLGKLNIRSTVAFPFNIMSSSVVSGYNKTVVDKVTASIEITNLHNDAYGPDMEVPMQGPFTNHVVGGHQSRHIALNYGSDDYTTRPEAWKLLLGKCVGGVMVSGALGLVGADYPWPEANAVDANPYPMTASQKAVYYRDLTAKSPVNIKNILLTSGSTPGSVVLGNYRKNYEVVSTFGAYSNPRSFLDAQPAFSGTIADQSNLTASDIAFNYLGLESNAAYVPNHYDYNLEQVVTDNSSSANRSVFVTRFSAPGSRETMARGFQDFRSGEFSVYNALGYRNLSVIKPSQGGSSTTAETAGIRVSDINFEDYGFRSHATRHAGQFGVDALQSAEYLLTSDLVSPSSAGTHAYKSKDSLQGWWRLNTDVSSVGDAIDSSGKGRNGTFDASGNRPEFTRHRYPAKKIQSVACTFDGTDDAVNVGAAATWNGIIGDSGTSKMTFATWVRLDPAASSYNQLFYFGESTSNVGRLALYYRVATNVWQFSTAWSPSAPTEYWDWDLDAAANSSIPNPENGEWQHVAITYDASSIFNEPILYINGVVVTDTSRNLPDGGDTWSGIETTDCFIGGTSENPTWSWLGQISDFAVWGSVLAADEIKALYNFINTFDSRPSIHKVNRNPKRKGQTQPDGTIIPVYRYDNLNVQHPIPQMDRQYSWVANSVVKSDDLRYYGRASVHGPLAGYHSSSTDGYVAYFDYVTASSAERGGITGALLQTTLGLNTVTIDPVSASSNTLGYSLDLTGTVAGSVASDSYINSALSGASGGGTTDSTDYLNLLLTRRRANYGWNWTAFHQHDHPIFQSERSSSIFSFLSTEDGTTLAHYRLPPVSLRGRPVLLNIPGGGNFNNSTTLKSTHNNEEIFFNDRDCNELLAPDPASIVTPYEQLAELYRGQFNWVLYSENLFPSLRNEFSSSVTTRVGYDNKFWRATSTERIALGATQTNTFGRTVSQSSWPLDAQSDWSTRTTYPLTDDFLTLIVNGKAGELQNNYFHTLNQYAGLALNTVSEASVLAPAALYARKHMLDTYTSVVGPNGPLIAETASICIRRKGIAASGSWPLDELTWDGGRYNGYAVLAPWGYNIAGPAGDVQVKQYPVEEYGGEAYWDAPAQAGLVEQTTLEYPASGSIRVIENANGPWGTKTVTLTDGNGKTVAFTASATTIAGLPRRNSSTSYDFGTSDDKAGTGLLSAIRLASEPKYEDLAITATQGPPWDVGNALIILTQDVSGAVGNTEIAVSAEVAAELAKVSHFAGGTSVKFIWSNEPSTPFHNNFDDFNHDVKLQARGYSVVPEFRISEHIEDYIKGGLFQEAKYDTFEVPGTLANSTTSSFYRDYSNSEFMTNFLKVKSDTLLAAKEIRLVCSAAIKFHPYKGFYPAQRTLDLVSQFSRSYGEGVSAIHKFEDSSDGAGTPSGSFTVLGSKGTLARPVLQPFFAPGILYNSIKSGMAVDYPIVSDPYKMVKASYDPTHTIAGRTWTTTTGSQNWAITAKRATTATSQDGYNSGSFWDKRISFEAIIDPVKHLGSFTALDMEPHPSASVNVTASWNGQASDSIYTLMSRNFFGEVGNFFLKDSGFTSLESSVISNDLEFESGSVYMARVKLRRSTKGARTYEYESSSLGTNHGFTRWGAAATTGSGGTKQGGGWPGTWDPATLALGSSSYPLPQDPQNNPDFKETFTMYSRPSAFGPPVAGIISDAQQTSDTNYTNYATASGIYDSFMGVNPAFTPPYYDGEAWLDLVFRPTAGTTYDLEKILAETKTVSWRWDPGIRSGPSASVGKEPGSPILIMGGPRLGVDHSANPIYAGNNINVNSMQLTHSINPFGIRDVNFQEKDKFGKTLTERNTIVGKQWVIQPKWETPMLNFNDEGVHPITNKAGNLTVPTYASASTPRGMWHQFGSIPRDTNKGIFLEIGDIPNDWLKNHYLVFNSASVYNNSTAESASTAGQIANTAKSLTELVGFNRTHTSKRLGELAESRKIREAIVAVPYVITTGDQQKKTSIFDSFKATTISDSLKQTKKFIEIPQQQFDAALSEAQGSTPGDSLEAAGESIRKLIQKMGRYSLPPEFDFVNNPHLTPIVMYMFEFEYELDRDDLSYIWQNLAPRNHDELTFQHQSVAHELMDLELLNESHIMDNENLRWMVFKVKQKSQTDYYDLVESQAGQRASTIGTKFTKLQSAFAKKSNPDSTYDIGFNWPYDYVSIVEQVKMDAEVLYKPDTETEQTLLENPPRVVPTISPSVVETPKVDLGTAIPGGGLVSTLQKSAGTTSTAVSQALKASPTLGSSPIAAGIKSSKRKGNKNIKKSTNVSRSKKKK